MPVWQVLSVVGMFVGLALNILVTLLSRARLEGSLTAKVEQLSAEVAGIKSSVSGLTSDLAEQGTAIATLTERTRNLYDHYRAQ